MLLFISLKTEGVQNMKIGQKIVKVFIIVTAIFSIVTFTFYSKGEFNKTSAEVLLKEAYLPLEVFVRSASPTEKDEVLLVPDNIKNEKDFVKLFDNKVNSRIAEGFFEDLVTEKEGLLYIDRTLYIPNIYAKESEITKAYIRERKSIYTYLLGDNDPDEKELVIKEKSMISGQWSKRSYYFVQNEKGEWILDSFEGTVMHGFVDIENNPWSNY